MAAPGSAPTSRLTFTILFAEPFWVGLFELAEGGHFGVARHIFRAEPTPPEVAEFVRRESLALLQHAAATAQRSAAPPVEGGPSVNPKRALRKAREASAERGIATRSQEALRLQHESRKRERRVATRAKRDVAAARRRAIARQKAQEKHRGH